MPQTSAEILSVRCIVACITSTGPDLTPYQVRCTPEQYAAGQHGDAAEDQARRDGHDPCLVFTPDDPPTWLFAQFGWADACLIDLT